MPDRRYFMARAGNDLCQVRGQPFVAAYELPTSPGDTEVIYRVIGDASQAEMVRLAVTLNFAMHNDGLWERVKEEMRHRIDAESEVAVQRAVQQRVRSPFEGTDHDEVSAA